MRLFIFLKGRERPVGYTTPGGYVKTMDGWKKKTVGRRKKKAVMQESVVGKKLPVHIETIRIPPAWTDVHYSEDPNADLLVTGKDAKGRLQYVYSESFRTSKTVEKFTRINALNESYTDIRAENRSNIGAGREEALVLLLVMETGIRPGSGADTKASKKAYGATTLEGRHVVREGDTVMLKFVGKKGIDLSIPIKSKQLARVLLKRKKQAGNDAPLFSVNAKQLSNYTQSLGGSKGFMTKDLRTHLGTTTAIAAMKHVEKPKSETAYKKAVREVAKVVAMKLGNTPIVSLQSYINPVIFANWKVVV